MASPRLGIHEAGPGQGDLFELLSAPADISSIVPEPSLAEMYCNQLTEPVSVRVATRAAFLGQALERFNHASKLAGLQNADNTAYSEVIRYRYGSKTDDILKATAEKQPRVEKEARQYFDVANGKDALKTAGLSPERAQELADEAFEEFRAKFGLTANAAIRNGQRKKLERNARKIALKPPELLLQALPKTI